MPNLITFGAPEWKVLAELEEILSSGLLPDIDTASQPTGKTLLTLACESGHVEVARRLVSLGADINHSLQCILCQKRTCSAHEAPHTYLFAPLCIAAQQGHLPVVQFLVEAGAVTDAAQGSKPLIAAASKGQTRVVRYLLEAGVDVKSPDSSGAPAPVCAAESGHLKVGGGAVRPRS